MQIALICSAPVTDYAYLTRRLAEFSQWIAIDGGANHCRQAGIVPQFIIGDLDSIEPSVLIHFKNVPLKNFPIEKDHSDLELAIAAINFNKIDSATIFCAASGRLDHTLNNLILLSRYPGKLALETENERSVAVNKKLELETFPNQIISLIPLNGPVHGIRTVGLKWELSNKSLSRDFVSISNRALGSKVEISVESGDLICIIEHQKTSEIKKESLEPHFDTKSAEI